MFVRDNKTKPVEKMTTLELRETFDRQSKLLRNTGFVEKLPDKGAKIKESQIRIEALLRQREEADQLTNLLSGLTLRVGKLPDVNKMEWGTDLSSRAKKPEVDEEQVNTKDDEPVRKDETSVIHILATTNQPVKSTHVDKKHVISKSELDALEEDKFSHDLIEKTEHHPEQSNHTRFLPNRSLRHDHLTADIQKSLARGANPARLAGQRPAHWNEDITSAHEPPTRYDHVKPLNLEDSLKLQLEHAEHLKKIELERAQERLAQRFNIKLELPEHITSDMQYRVSGDDVDDILGGLRDQVNHEIEEQEIADEDDVKDVGIITYTNSEIE